MCFESCSSLLDWFVHRSETTPERGQESGEKSIGTRGLELFLQARPRQRPSARGASWHCHQYGSRLACSADWSRCIAMHRDFAEWFSACERIANPQHSRLPVCATV